MGSTHDDASQIALVEELVDVGNMLLKQPSAIDEILVLLERGESVLSKVWQHPPRPTKVALIPLMKALITNELLRHPEMSIQVAVASCFNELTRISAPEFTYSDPHMKEFFQLCMIALKHLSSESGRNYSRALHILETVARVRSCLILLDIDCGALIVEMFQLFFNTIRPNHPSDTFKYMEMIMTLVIQESDEISFELLKPLLDSVKMDNKNISQISWELGTTVFKNCSVKLQCQVREAVKSMNLDIDDYAEIVTTLCQDTTSEKTMVAKEDGSTDGVSNTANEDVDAGKIAESERESGSFQRRRARTPSLQKPEEGYKHNWATGIKDSCKVPKYGKNQAKEIYGSANEGNLSRKSQSSKKKSLKNPDADLESPPKLSGKITSNVPKKTGNEQTQDDIILKKHKPKGSNKRARMSHIGYGEDLVNLRVKVWWPEDKTFYTGTILSFDPSTRKHEVLYDDDETETLNMDDEIWEPFDDPRLRSYSKIQEADPPPGPGKEPLETEKKTAKKKPASAKKKNAHAPSSSKKSKGDSSSGTKSGKTSVPDFVNIKDEPDAEMHESNMSSKNDGENPADNPEAKT